jgi:hypothetical protein
VCADRKEPVGDLQAYDLVCVLLEFLDRLGRRNGNCQHDTGRTLPTHDLAGCGRRRPGGKAVVHHNHGLAVEGHPGPVTPKQLRAPIELDAFTGFHCGERLGAHPGELCHLFVDYAHVALGDGSHPELWLERHTELTDDDHVEWGVQCSGDLVGDRDATPW